jgi:HAD superfamily hydrolase (TIGR01458 family)
MGATERPDAVLLDIDGVLVVSWKAIAGAADAITALRTADVPFRLITNTTSRSRGSIAAAVSDAGIAIEPDEVLTAPIATATYVAREHPGARCLLLSSGDISDELQTFDLEVLVLGELPADESVDVVILGGAGPEFTYEAISELFDRVVAGTPLVAMHRNLSWRTDRGLQLDTGAFLTAVEQAAHVEATVLGKPSCAFFGSALEQLGVPAERAWMVGDDLDADVLGAQACGLDGVLVQTGKFDARQLERSDGQPDHVIDSIADLPALLGIT